MTGTSGRTVGVVIPTYRGARGLPRCLAPLLEADLGPVLVVDSSSDDRTVETAERLGARTRVIPRNEFNHGATREWARSLLGTDVVIMATQDAFAASADDVRRLAMPVVAGAVAMAYGRQVARRGAGLLERFPRAFSYPTSSASRTRADIAALGSGAYFCSNAFAAWDNAALDAVGGFPRALTHEDAIACSRLLRGGYAIRYVADAVVEHSHDLRLRQEFQRYFDAGMVRAAFRAELDEPGGVNAQGLAYARRLLRAAWSDPADTSAAIGQIGVRLAGYRLGRMAFRFGPHRRRT